MARWRAMPPRRRRLIAGLVVGAMMAMVSAIVASSLEHYLAVRVPSMAFLCSVILAALWFGRGVALVTALFAFFVYNFYLTEPRNTFGFAGVEDVLTLLVFIATALLIGGMAGTLYDERERAREQARIFSDLFAASRTLAACDSAGSAAVALVASVRRLAAQEAAWIRPAEADDAIMVHADPAEVPVPPLVVERAQTLFNCMTPDRLVEGWRLHRLETEDSSAGVLAWKPMQGVSEEHIIAVRLLIELTMAAVERRQNLDREIELDMFAARERLRTALMSSMSHDFRTPLSTILASASSLLAYGEQFSPATRTDLLVSIQEEAERLNRFVGNILNMTRLDAGVVQPQSEWIDPVDVLEQVADRFQKRLAGRGFSVSTPAAVPAILVDPVLLEQAVYNVIENALVHTPANCAIRIGADYTSSLVRMWVEDDGPGVAPEELSTIFDKFHRSPNSANKHGAGLGLAISRGFIEAMQGAVSASKSASGGLRIEFSFAIQVALARP